MISPVDKYIEQFANAGADIITFHPEATKDTGETIKLIRKFKKKPIEFVIARNFRMWNSNPVSN